jgi:hypothetical protein
VGVARPRAGDDQHGDRGGEGRGDRASGAEPEPQGRHRQGDHDGDEDAGDLVGQPLRLGLAVLSFLHQLGHLGQLGVRADTAGTHHDPAADIDGGADHRVVDADLDGHRFPGQHRCVDRGGAFHDDAVGGDLLTGAHDEQVAHGELLGRYALFLAVAQHRYVFGAQFQQRSQRGTGLPLGSGLEVAAGEDEGGDSGRHLEIDVPGPTFAGDGQFERVRHARHTRSTPEQCV